MAIYIPRILYKDREKGHLIDLLCTQQEAFGNAAIFSDDVFRGLLNGWSTLGRYEKVKLLQAARQLMESRLNEKARGANYYERAYLNDLKIRGLRGWTFSRFAFVAGLTAVAAVLALSGGGLLATIAAAYVATFPLRECLRPGSFLELNPRRYKSVNYSYGKKRDFKAAARGALTPVAPTFKRFREEREKGTGYFRAWWRAAESDSVRLGLNPLHWGLVAVISIRNMLTWGIHKIARKGEGEETPRPATFLNGVIYLGGKLITWPIELFKELGNLTYIVLRYGPLVALYVPAASSMTMGEIIDDGMLGLSLNAPRFIEWGNKANIDVRSYVRIAVGAVGLSLIIGLITGSIMPALGFLALVAASPFVGMLFFGPKALADVYLNKSRASDADHRLEKTLVNDSYSLLKIRVIGNPVAFEKHDDVAMYPGPTSASHSSRRSSDAADTDELEAPVIAEGSDLARTSN